MFCVQRLAWGHCPAPRHPSGYTTLRSVGRGEHIMLRLLALPRSCRDFCWPGGLLSAAPASTPSVGFREWALGWKCFWGTKKICLSISLLLQQELHSISGQNLASQYAEIIPCNELLRSGSCGAYLLAYSCRVLFLSCHITVINHACCKEQATSNLLKKTDLWFWPL